MTYREVKATGAKTLGTLSYVPKEEWDEIPLDRLRQFEADLLNRLGGAETGTERDATKRRHDHLSAAIEKAERGERVFGVVWNEDEETLFACNGELRRVGFEDPPLLLRLLGSLIAGGCQKETATASSFTRFLNAT